MLPEPLIALSAAASVTRRVEVGTCILQLPLRRPVELAHRVLTAQLVCGNRLTLGVGAGSTRDDYDAVGVDYEDRFHAFAEALATMRALWTGKIVDQADLTPWPATRGGPPVLIGSWAGSTWIQRAATEYEGWIASAAKTTWRTLEESMARFRAAGGRRAVVTNLLIDLSGPDTDAENPDDPVSLVCSPPIARDRIARLRDIGFDDIILLSQRQTPQTLESVRAIL